MLEKKINGNCTRYAASILSYVRSVTSMAMPAFLVVGMYDWLADVTPEKFYFKATLGAVLVDSVLKVFCRFYGFTDVPAKKSPNKRRLVYYGETAPDFSTPLPEEINWSELERAVNSYQVHK